MPYVLTEVTAIAGSNGDHFGHSVAISGDGTTIVVGANYRQPVIGGPSGAAYVFRKVSGLWVQQIMLLPSDGINPQEQFGTSVAISGDGSVVVIGSPGRGNGGYVYSGTGWATETKLASPTSNSGWSVAISRDATTIAVGAPQQQVNKQGTVYVFTGSNWSTQTTVVSFDNTNYGAFGYSVDLNDTGAYLAVGASEDIINGNGKAYVCSGTSWATQTKLVASDASSISEFGTSISISGDGSVVAVGSPFHTFNRQGKVYVYSGASWTNEQTFIADVPTNFDWFGFSIGLNRAGTKLAIGTRDWNGSQPGAVFVYSYSGGSWSNSTKTVGPVGDNRWFGESVDLTDSGNVYIAGAGENLSNPGFAYIGALSVTSMYVVFDE